MSDDYYRLTKVQLEDGTKLCLKKVLTILDDVEILCVNYGSEATSVSLYTIAVEEYGKFLLLKEILNSKSDQIMCMRSKNQFLEKARVIKKNL